MITNSLSGTRIEEVASGIYRINTPYYQDVIPGGFSFNQYLVVDDEPLLFHAGLRRLFPLIQEAIAAVMPVEKLRYVGISHFEADEAGALNDFLRVAPHAKPLCSDIGAMVSINDFADRPAKGMADGEVISLGRHKMKWISTPHVPHGWDCGFLFDQTTETLLCGDLFTQGGSNTPATTEQDILAPSELFRKPLDYFAHAKDTAGSLERLAATNPRTLACMHGSAYKGNGGALIRELSAILTREQAKSAIG